MHEHQLGVQPSPQLLPMVPELFLHPTRVLARDGVRFLPTVGRLLVR